MLEIRLDGLIHRQRNPQLHGVQAVHAFRSLLGVGNPACIAGARRHQVYLLGADQLAKA